MAEDILAAPQAGSREVTAAAPQADTREGGYSSAYSGAYTSSSYSSEESSDSGSSYRDSYEERKRAEDFNSAQKSFNDASWRYSNYAASGSVQNAATQEHFMHEAMGNMLKSKSSGGDKAAFESAQKSYNYASMQMASYKKQGLTENALTQQHHMNLAMADMIKNSSPPRQIKQDSKAPGRTLRMPADNTPSTKNRD